jgi:hypothetical protein
MLCTGANKSSQLKIVINQAEIPPIPERAPIKSRCQRKTTTPSCTGEQGQQRNACALIRGSGQSAIRAKISSRQLRAQSLRSAKRIAQWIRRFNEMVNRGVVAKNSQSKTLCGNAYRDLRAGSLNGFVYRCEMNATTQRKQVLQNKYAVYPLWNGSHATPTRYTLGCHYGTGREIHQALFQGHSLLFSRDANYIL